jgi:tRNA 2-thiouridine synthesizing protein C
MIKDTQKKILFINRTFPYGSSRAQEGLDVLLMASAFNQIINVLFIDQSILQLKKSQNPKVIAQKKFTKTFKALPLYDIDNIYLEETALLKYQLSEQDLIIPVTVVNSDTIGKLMREHDAIFNF